VRPSRKRWVGNDPLSGARARDPGTIPARAAGVAAETRARLWAKVGARGGGRMAESNRSRVGEAATGHPALSAVLIFEKRGEAGTLTRRVDQRYWVR
jgi:hypothetical protein